MSEILASANYKLKGKGHNGGLVDVTVKATLQKSGAFDYGNGTCMILEWSDRKDKDLYDTRYSKVSPKNFTEFAKEQIEMMVLDTITVEEMRGDL